MYNQLIINSMYCNVSVCPTVIVLASGPTRRVHTVMLYVNLILRVRANWRQGPLAKNAPSDVRGIVTQEVDRGVQLWQPKVDRARAKVRVRAKARATNRAQTMPYSPSAVSFWYERTTFRRQNWTGGPLFTLYQISRDRFRNRACVNSHALASP